MDLRQALSTTGAVRHFRPDPVPDEVVHRILDAARFAPSGGNRQSWHVVLVKDRTTRQRLRDLYLPPWYQYLAQRAAGLVPFAPITDEDAERTAIAGAPSPAEAVPPAGGAGFPENLDHAPVMLVVLADLRALAALDKDADRYPFCGGASVYPFIWSVLLAARDEGLGGVLTTILVRREHEVRALLGVPGELAVAAVVFLGRPVRQLSRLTRRRVEEFATVDRFDGDPFTAS